MWEETYRMIIRGTFETQLSIYDGALLLKFLLTILQKGLILDVVRLGSKYVSDINIKQL